jgi:hypothetical protein
MDGLVFVQAAAIGWDNIGLGGAHGGRGVGREQGLEQVAAGIDWAGGASLIEGGWRGGHNPHEKRQGGHPYATILILT